MSKEYYGIDAPTVVRNMGLIAAALGAVSVIFGHTRALLPVLPAMRSIAVGLAIGCCWMLVSSLFLKHRMRDTLLGCRSWRGDERVLDVGCGRGLLAIGAARRVPNGRVVGFDKWQAVDLSDNNPQGFLANAAAAGVADRVKVETGDARELPFSDGSFDVVGSMTVIHNIPDAAGRAAAVAEIWRVTRPGGQILIFDIHHARTYARQLRALGADLTLTGPILLWGIFGWRFTATKP